MSLEPGARLGRYEILSMLGAGGMGQVYRARDARLDRPVAIKILAPEFGASAEFRGRFDREARAISQLSHPNICTLYDVGHEDGLDFLVMELLDGQTLSDRIRKGPLPIGEALRIGAALARGLDAAHRRGIVHRDLKPGNVMLTSSGVKLLDFGLARERPVPSPHDASVMTAAVDDPLTAHGAILGTLPYMAPEQVEGRTADPRSDIFALGAVLYETIAGTRPFSGGNPAALASAILTTHPAPLSEVRQGTPRSVDRVISTCLAKHPDERWQTAHDVALQLDAAADDLKSGVSSGSAVSNAVGGQAPSALRRWIPLAAAAALGAVATAITLTLVAGGRAERGRAARTPMAFLLPPPAGATFATTVEAVPMAVSPDGRTIAVVAVGSSGAKIFLRRLDDPVLTPLEGTDGARSIFWSPDGGSLAFVAGGKIKRVTPGAGGPVSLFDVPEAIGVTGSWGADGQIVFSTVEGHAIWRGSTSGGEREVVVEPDPAKNEARTFWPHFLPDGRRFLYVLNHRDGKAKLMLHEPGRPATVVMPDTASFAEYVDPGYLVYRQDGALVARRFDAARGRLEGEPFAIADQVVSSGATLMTAFATSRSGVVVHQAARDVGRIVWIDRQGRPWPLLTSGQYQTVRFSPDRTRVLFDRQDARVGTWDLWELDIARGTEHRLTPSPGTDSYGVYAPNGQVLYAHTTGGPPQLSRLDPATGTSQPLLPQDRFHLPYDVHPSGSPLVFGWRSARGRFYLHAMELVGAAKPVPLWRAELAAGDARFSPDGTMLAFTSFEEGRPDVHVAAFPSGRRVVVSQGGGFSPRWHPNGRELYFLTQRHLMVTSITGGVMPTAGVPQAVLEIDSAAPWVSYDVAPDGTRFLVIVSDVIARREPLAVRMHWAK